MIIINVETRKEHGKGASRRLRKNNKLPGIIYGINKKSISIIINHNEIINYRNNPEFYKTLILIFDGKENKVKIQAIQHHPFKPKFIHIDFLLVN